MTLERLSTVALAAFAAMALGCGPDPAVTPDAGTPEDAGGDAGQDAGPPDAGPEWNADSLCVEIAKQRCDFLIRCNGEATVTQRYNSLVPEAQRELCIARESARADCQSVAQSWRAGRVTVDPQKLTDCYSRKYPSGTCSRYAVEHVPFCAGSPWIVPLVPNGEQCRRDDECENGYCTATAASCGACAPFKAVGDTCTQGRHVECDPSVGRCRTAGNPPVSTCALYVAIGGQCSSDFICGPGNVCVGTGMNRSCRAAKQLGQTCISGNYECLRRPGESVELICSAASGGTGTCIRAESERGQPCQTSEQLAGGAAAGPICPDTDYCSGSSVCEPRLGEGQGLCVDVSKCAPGLRCAGGTCTAYSTEGGVCDSSSTQINHCAMLLECISGECVPEYAMLGEGCSIATPCAEGFCGADGGCQPLGEGGSACSSNSECKSGMCNPDGGGCDDSCWD